MGISAYRLERLNYVVHSARIVTARPGLACSPSALLATRRVMDLTGCTIWITAYTLPEGQVRCSARLDGVVTPRRWPTTGRTRAPDTSPNEFHLRLCDTHVHGSCDHPARSSFCPNARSEFWITLRASRRPPAPACSAQLYIIEALRSNPRLRRFRHQGTVAGVRHTDGRASWWMHHLIQPRRLLRPGIEHDLHPRPRAGFERCGQPSPANRR
jgi:hypothetical protein